MSTTDKPQPRKKRMSLALRGAIGFGAASLFVWLSDSALLTYHDEATAFGVVLFLSCFALSGAVGAWFLNAGRRYPNAVVVPILAYGVSFGLIPFLSIIASLGAVDPDPDIISTPGLAMREFGPAFVFALCVAGTVAAPFLLRQGSVTFAKIITMAASGFAGFFVGSQIGIQVMFRFGYPADRFHPAWLSAGGLVAICVVLGYMLSYAIGGAVLGLAISALDRAEEREEQATAKASPEP